MDPIEAMVWQEVRAVLANPTRLHHEYARRAEVARHGTEDETVTSLTVRLRTAQRGRERLIDSYAEGLLTREDFAPRIMRLTERIAALEAQRREAEAGAE